MDLDLRHAVLETDDCECGNCLWEGTVKDVAEIKNAEQRLYPSDPVPVGECPECHALAYLVFESDKLARKNANNV